MTDGQVQVQPQAMGVPPPQKTTRGCGCWLWGCLGLVIIGFLSCGGIGVFLYYAPSMLVSDTTVQWGYKTYGRNAIHDMLPATMSEAEKDRILRESDATLNDFFKLPKSEKDQIKHELVIYLTYSAQDKVPPPEKIPHLLKFVSEHLDRFQNSPQDAPRLMQ